MSEQQAFLTGEFDAADADMARRLLDLRQDPSSALLARICAIPGQPQPRRMPHWVWGLATGLLLLAVIVGTSPPLRAAFATFRQIIGQVSLSIADRSPDTGDADIREPQLMSLQAAQAAVPFHFDIPGRAPAGWAMAEPVRVNDLGGGPFVEVVWTRPGYGHISFLARAARQEDGSPAGWLVGPDSYQEIVVDGQPAVLFRGGWDANSRQWAWPEMTTIVWTRGDVQYHLVASSDDVSDLDLIAMAQSVP